MADFAFSLLMTGVVVQVRQSLLSCAATGGQTSVIVLRKL